MRRGLVVGTGVLIKRFPDPVPMTYSITDPMHNKRQQCFEVHPFTVAFIVNTFQWCLK
jgi:hypothetical protein